MRCSRNLLRLRIRGQLPVLERGQCQKDSSYEVWLIDFPSDRRCSSIPAPDSRVLVEQKACDHTKLHQTGQ